MAAVQLALALPYLGSVPRFYDDEAWHASLGYELAQHGVLRHGVLKGWGGIDRHLVQDMVVLPLVSAPVYAAAGLSIVTARACSALTSVAALVCVYGLMRRWFGGRQALAIALCTAVFPWFFEISRRVRPEIYYVALTYASGWALSAALAGARRRTASVAGVLAGLAALAHPNGLLAAAAMAGGMFLWFWRPAGARCAALFVTGFLAVAATFGVYVLWATNADASVSFLAQMKGTHELMAGGAAGMLAGEAGRWREFFQLPWGLPLAAVTLAALLATCWRSSREEKALATILILYVAAMFFTSNYAARYLAPVLPLMAALIMRLIVRLWAFRWWLSAAAAAVYVAMSVGAIGLMLARLHAADPAALMARVAQATDDQGPIYSHMLLWMDRSRPYGPIPLDDNWNVTAEMLRRENYRYVVRLGCDWRSSRGVSMPKPDMPPLGQGHIAAVDEVCKDYGTLVASFFDRFYGPVEVYRMDWGR